MHIDGAAVAVILKAPHLVQQLVAGVDAVRVGGQTVQQFQLLGGSLHHLALDPQLIAVHVQTQVVEFDHALGALGSSVVVWQRRSTALMRATTSLASKGFTM